MKVSSALRTFAPAFFVLAGTSAFGAEEPAADRRIRIVNDSTHVITAFYAANVSVRTWPDSLLGNTDLKPGTSIVLDLEDGSGYCRFRFRAVFDDGKELLRSSVNVCQVGTYRYTE
jgi:hypothetical protein